MKKTLHFISGLPRSGSTLLCNLLAQNPRFHATTTSGILDVMLLVRNQWDKLPEFQATRNEAGKLRALTGILRGYHDEDEQPRPVVFDKSRGWLGFLEMAEAVLGRKAKVLVCVRDVRDVLASFERLWRENTATRQFAQEQESYYKWQTVEGRCEVWMAPHHAVGTAYARVKDALARGFRDRMHFVEFDKLTGDPTDTMHAIYDFLGEDFFQHDFENVQQVTWEDDEMHGVPNLHTIRPKVCPVPSQWPKYLGAAAEPYLSLNKLWEPYLPESSGQEAVGHVG